MFTFKRKKRRRYNGSGERIEATYIGAEGGKGEGEQGEGMRLAEVKPGAPKTGSRERESEKVLESRKMISEWKDEEQNEKESRKRVRYPEGLGTLEGTKTLEKTEAEGREGEGSPA